MFLCFLFLKVAFYWIIMYHNSPTMDVLKTAVKILHATVGIQSNREKLLPHLTLETKIESLLTDFQSVETIPFALNLDGLMTINESDSDLFYEKQCHQVHFSGPFLKLQNEASDPRYTFWGNQGFLYRYILYLLEKKHKIYNFHACALHDEDSDILYVMTGGAGSGKSVCLLRGIEKGLKLFSTETVHFQINEESMVWQMGSLMDNIRFGTLLYDFSRFLPSSEIPAQQELWQKKVALDLSEHKAQREVIENPCAVRIFFPRIERGFEKTILNPVKEKQKAIKGLYDNISQKLAETVILYDKLVVLGLDEKDLADDRLAAVAELVNHSKNVQIFTLLSNPRDCWEHILK
jgi:hypothetical protein